MPEERQWPGSTTLYLSKIIVSALIVLIAFRVADKLARRADPLPTIPEPNAYSMLLEFAGQVKTPSADLIDLEPDSIRKVARTNAPILGKVHEALRKDSSVPLSTKKGWVDEHAKDVKTMKRLAVALGIQSRADILEGRTNTAATSLLDIILLGHCMSRGGTINDGINSMVVETIGTASLRALLSQLDSVTCRTAAQQLERFEKEREPADRIFKTDRDWSVASFGLGGRLAELFMGKSRGQRQTDFAKRYTEVTKRTRRLIMLLAERAAQQETGEKVNSAAELVPSVLSVLPTNPENGKPLAIQAPDSSANER